MDYKLAQVFAYQTVEALCEDIPLDLLTVISAFAAPYPVAYDLRSSEPARVVSLHFSLPLGTSFLVGNRFFVVVPSHENRDADELLCELDFETNTVISSTPIPLKHRLLDVSISCDTTILLLERRVDDHRRRIFVLDTFESASPNLFFEISLPYDSNISSIHKFRERRFLGVSSPSSQTIYELVDGRLDSIRSFSPEALITFKENLCAVLSQNKLRLFDFTTERRPRPKTFATSWPRSGSRALRFSDSHPFALQISDRHTLMPLFY